MRENWDELIQQQERRAIIERTLTSGRPISEIAAEGGRLQCSLMGTFA